MIRVYNQPLDDGRILVNVHGRVCNQDHLKSRICANEGSATGFVQSCIGSIVSETIIHYLNQRHQAAKHSRYTPTDFWQAYDSIRQEFQNIESLPTVRLMHKVVSQSHHLKTMLPGKASLFSSWIETINSLIAFCQKVADANPTQPLKS